MPARYLIEVPSTDAPLTVDRYADLAAINALLAALGAEALGPLARSFEGFVPASVPSRRSIGRRGLYVISTASATRVIVSGVTPLVHGLLQELGAEMVRLA